MHYLTINNNFIILFIIFCINYSRIKTFLKIMSIYSGPPIFNFILGYPDEEYRG